jgi:protein TonB
MFSNHPTSRPRTVAIATSLAWHAGAGVLLFLAAQRAPVRQELQAPRVVSLPAIVWLDKAGDDGGGGSGGNESTSPAAPARRVGRDALTTPVSRPPDPLAPAASDPPEPEKGLDIPAVAMASGLETLPGAIQSQPGPPSVRDALGAGTGGGVGDRRGRGEGGGDGDGLGDGGPRGVGSGPYRLGAGGLTPPVPLYRGAPRYTPEAAHARVQGSVLVECIVQPTGRCSDLRIVRSIEPPFGLDREAIAAAGAWRFRPGVLGGRQVPVLVTIEVAFTIR